MSREKIKCEPGQINASRYTYRDLFSAALSDNDLAEIRECMHKGWALGSERFRKQVEALGPRRAASKAVGPRRTIIVPAPIRCFPSINAHPLEIH
ncbi:hypothetical protein [Methylomicrobium sp. Wu6]|uniref:hypothetical protein n=1 Tax=Methylomicrobium sp. Wu6 TaxID=3107928 RepID=UPI002DD66713|nr:hypothetical protein [Methylomicrobium sp. Wu6]MEC4749442.1 hypothetical protein [Methylomicrobium sp. Wu6]